MNTEGRWNALGWGLANPEVILEHTLEHLWLTAMTLLIAGAIALPLGIAVVRMRMRGLDVLVLGALGVVYTIPSLAFFVLLVPWLGLGRDTALVALVAYAQVVLVRNVVAGLRGVDASVIEAARGMGMSGFERLWHVELPLAAPVMLAGARVATVSVIAIGTVAALIRAGGLGELLFVGVATSHRGKIVAGAVAVSVLALGFNVGFRWLESRVGEVVRGTG